MFHQMIGLHLIDHPQHGRVAQFPGILNDLGQAFINDKDRQPPAHNTYFTKLWVNGERVSQTAMTIADVSKCANPRRLTIHLDQPIVDDMARTMLVPKLGTTSHSWNIMLI